MKALLRSIKTAENNPPELTITPEAPLSPPTGSPTPNLSPMTVTPEPTTSTPEVKLDVDGDEIIRNYTSTHAANDHNLDGIVNFADMVLQ